MNDKPELELEARYLIRGVETVLQDTHTAIRDLITKYCPGPQYGEINRPPAPKTAAEARVRLERQLEDAQAVAAKAERRLEEFTRRYEELRKDLEDAQRYADRTHWMGGYRMLAVYYTPEAQEAIAADLAREQAIVDAEQRYREAMDEEENT